MHDVAILIVTYNSAKQIGPCLRSVLAQRERVSQQIVVVDNASTDDTVEVIRREFPDVYLVLPGRNLGFAAGVNEAARHADARFLLLLNPDTEILDHAVDRIVAFADENPRHALYGGRTLKPDGSLEPSSCFDRPTLWSMAMFATGLSTVAPRNRWLDPESLGRWQRDTVREVGVITGCFLLVTADAWKKLGGLDERYFMYGEDVDFALRARAAGYLPVVCPNAELVHELGQSSATPIHKMMLLYRGKAELVRTHWTGIAQTAALAFLQMGVWLRATLGKLKPGTGGDRWSELWARRGEWIGGYGSREAEEISCVPDFQIQK